MVKMSLDGFIILATLCKTTVDRVNAQVAITLANAPYNCPRFDFNKSFEQMHRFFVIKH